MSSPKSDASGVIKYLQIGAKFTMGGVGLEPTTPCV